MLTIRAEAHQTRQQRSWNSMAIPLAGVEGSCDASALQVEGNSFVLWWCSNALTQHVSTWARWLWTESLGLWFFAWSIFKHSRLPVQRGLAASLCWIKTLADWQMWPACYGHFLVKFRRMWLATDTWIACFGMMETVHPIYPDFLSLIPQQNEETLRLSVHARIAGFQVVKLWRLKAIQSYANQNTYRNNTIFI